eukprot:2406532-Prymnesium_polylepis.2
MTPLDFLPWYRLTPGPGCARMHALSVVRREAWLAHSGGRPGVQTRAKKNPETRSSQNHTFPWVGWTRHIRADLILGVTSSLSECSRRVIT